MPKTLINGCILSCMVLFHVNSYAATQPTDPVVTINDKTLTQQDYDEFVKLWQERTNTPTPPDTQTVIEELISRELILQDALKGKVDQQADFKKKLEDVRLSLLIQASIKNYVDSHPLDDATLKKKFDEILASQPLPKEYHSRHILLANEADAKAVIAELDKGKSFSELAKAKSTDAATAEKGGDLEWAGAHQLVPSFAEAVEKLEKGKYTKTPIKSEFGWHVILLEDTRDSKPPEFDTVKENVRKMMQQQLVGQYLEELRKKAQVKVLKPIATDKKAETQPPLPQSESAEKKATNATTPVPVAVPPGDSGSKPETKPTEQSPAKLPPVP